jgi:uncharacterized tellurite resistance protein B-like protein
MTEEPTSSRIEGDELISETQGDTETYDAKYLVAVLLVYVAKGDGTISTAEGQEMMALIEDQYGISGAESLALLTRAISDIAENSDMSSLLREIGAVLGEAEKEHIAVMLLKLVAADGRKNAEEMGKLHTAGDMMGISEEAMHRAFDRYFEESQVLPSEEI